jgi:UDP-N-acetyl-D-mannosaminuronate dehydrogenase
VNKEKVLILGLGEVGHTFFYLLKESGKFDVYALDSDKLKMENYVGQGKPPKNVDVMHICYPCPDQEKFVQSTLNYIRAFRPKLTIIDSTVNPGTTRRIFKQSKSPLVHSPIRGMHTTPEMMIQDVLFWPKYIGGTTEESARAAQTHFRKLGLKVKVLKGPEETELAKLFDTTYRAWMIACFQEMHRISRCFKADFDEVVDFVEDGHRVLYDRPVHYPDVIGGHCLIPNTELLLKSYDSKFLRLILESNERRKEEVKDRKLKQEIQKIRNRADALHKELVKRKTSTKRPSRK